MRQFYLSSAPQSMFLMVGSDPNVSRPEIIQLKGIETPEVDVEIRIENEAFTTVFAKLYRGIQVRSQSFLEYFTYLPSGRYILSIRANEREMKMNLTFH